MSPHILALDVAGAPHRWTLEKVTEKVDKLTVFGGLDGVLKDVVRIQVPTN